MRRNRSGRRMLQRMVAHQQHEHHVGVDGKSHASEKPLTYDEPGVSGQSRTQLLSEQAIPQSDSSSTPSPPSVSTSIETLSLDSDEEEMPLRLPRLRLRKSKESLNEKTSDAASVASVSSLASSDSWTQQASGEHGGYTVSKLKELSKLHKAVWKDNLGKVKTALASLKKPMYVDFYDKENRTALHFACVRGHVDIIKAICDAGANPNIADNQGATPLHKLIEIGCSGGLVHVLASGADPNVCDHLGRTPLHLAAKMGDLSSVSQLIAKEARIDVIEKCGLTPLHIATLNGHGKVVSLLIREGADVDYQDSMGRTALMTACVEGKRELIQLFLESDADTLLKDKDGLSALDLALSKNHHDCARLLESSRQKVKSQSQPTPFLDQSLLSAVYSPAADNQSYEGPPTNLSAHESVSEELSSVLHTEGSSWAGTDTEDDPLTPHNFGSFSLKAALVHKLPKASLESELAVAQASDELKPRDYVAEGFKGQTTPPVSYNRYQLSTTEAASPPLVTKETDVDDNMSPFDLPDSSPSKLPSVVAVSTPSQTTPLMETTPTAIPADVGGTFQALALDEEISDSDSEFEDEEGVDGGEGYVPSTREQTPTWSDVLKQHNFSVVRGEGTESVGGVSCDDVRGDALDKTHTDTFVISPLSSGQFTSEFLSPENSGPARLITGRSRQPEMGVVSDKELSELMESEDEDVERLLEKASNLSASHDKPTLLEDEYEESDWDDDKEEEATEDESEDDEPHVSALMSMSGAALHNPILSPSRSPWRSSSSEELKHADATPPPAGDATPPVCNESEESEVNFDSEDDELDNLLPSDKKEDSLVIHPAPVSMETPPPPSLTTSHSATHDGPSLPHSLTLSPLHSSSSLRNLPPLTIGSRALGPIAGDPEQPVKMASVTNKEGHSPKPSDQSSYSMDSESESEWEREKKEKKRLSASQQLDSGMDTMATNTMTTTESSEPTASKLLEGSLPSRSSTNVDPLTVSKNTSTCVDPQFSSSVDQEETTESAHLPDSHSKNSVADSILSSQPSQSLALRVPGCSSISSHALDPPPVHSYQSLLGEGSQSKSSPTLSVLKKEETPVVSTVDEETPVISVVDEETPVISVVDEETPVISTVDEETPMISVVDEETPVISAVDEETPVISVTNEGIASREGTHDPPAAREEEAPVITLTNEQVLTESNNESILEMLSDASEVEEDTEEGVVADFSGPALLHLDTSVPPQDEDKLTAEKETVTLQAQPTNEPPSIADTSLQIKPTTTVTSSLSRESSDQWTECSTPPVLSLASIKSSRGSSAQVQSRDTPIISVTSVSSAGSVVTTVSPSRDLLQPLSEHKSVEILTSLPSLSSEHATPPFLRSHDVLLKLSQLGGASLAGTSSGDIEQRVSLREDTPSSSTFVPKTTSHLNLTKRSLSSLTQQASSQAGSASDSRLELKKSVRLSEDVPLSKDVPLSEAVPLSKDVPLSEDVPLLKEVEETVDSEESELSLATGLSRHGFPQDTTLTPSQLHTSTPEARPPTLIPLESDDFSHDLSLSDLSGHLDQPSHDFLSQSSKMSDDLPMSRYVQLNQSLRSSQGGGVSLLSSAHTAQLQESLRETTHDLKKSQNEAMASERMRKQLESQLDDCQKKFNSALSSKMSLEDVKLDLELQVRELKYQLDQSREGMRSSEGICSQLKEQLDRMEMKLTREVESRQAAELKCREAELAHRSLTVAHQALQEELSELSSRLQGEREAKILQEGLYKEQGRLYEALREESHKTQEVKSELQGKLELSDKAREELQEQVATLMDTNAQQHSQLTVEKRRAEEVEGQLESVRAELCDKVEGRAQFEAHLRELKEKAEFLSTALEQEAAQRSQAQEEAISVKTQLNTVTSELDSLHTRSREREQLLTQQIEELKQERTVREKDLEIVRNLHSQQSSKTEVLETRLQDSEKELKATNALLFERANQIAALQRDVDHKGSRVSGLEESLQVEHERQTRLETQLGVANEKISSLQSEGVALKQQVEFAQRRVEEKERSGVLTQQRQDDLMSTLRTEFDKSKASLEEKCQSLVEAQASLREDVVRKEEKMAAMEREKEELKTEISQLNTTQKELLERLEGTEEAYSEAEAEKNELLHSTEQLEAKIEELVNDITAKTNQTSLLKEKVSGLQTSLSEAHQTTRVALDEKQGAVAQKAVIESQLQHAHKQVSSLEAQLEAEHKKEEGLEKTIAHLQEVRSTLQTHLSETQAELSQTSAELDLMTLARDKALTEVEEVRALWENEVRSRSKLGMKLMEIEKSQVDASSLVDAEKRRTRKALEMKKGAEWKLEALQKDHTQLTSEAATARIQLKQSRRRVRELEFSQSQVPGLRAECERKIASRQRELEGLKELITSSQDRYKRELEKRHRAEQAAIKVRQELEEVHSQLTLGQSETHSRHKEMLKVERANRKLREELAALQEHVATHMISKSELEVYKKAIEEKAHRELSSKLEEVNHHLEQQSQTQEALARLRMSAESEQREKFDRSSTEMRLELGQCKSDKQTAVSEAKRYKELYEAELMKSTNLGSLLHRAKEDSEDCHNKLSLERSRTHQLMSTTQMAALGSLTPPRHTRYTESHPRTSTPHGLSPSPDNLDLSPTDSLLKSVRTKLDQSIARHKNRVPTTRNNIGTATRNTYSHHKAPLESLPSHLEAIRRNYRI